MNFNFEGTRLDALCNISEKRSHELTIILADVASEITENHIQYSITDPDGGHSMHKGKILKRFFEAVSNEQEQIFVTLLFESLVEAMRHQVTKKRLMEAVKSGINIFLDKLHGKEQSVKNEGQSQTQA